MNNFSKFDFRNYFVTIKVYVGVLLIFSTLFLASIEAKAKTEVREFSVSMERQNIVQGNIPFIGQWGPVRDAHLIKISVPSTIDDFRVSFVKSGFSTSDCGNPSRVVTIRDGSATNPDQIKEIYGVKRVSANSTRVNFVACAVAPANRDIPRFIIKIHYEKEIDEDENKGSDKDKAPPPVKTQTFEQVNQARIYSALCQQLHSNKGCGMSFSCPTGYALTNIRAACDLETGRIKPLPEWGSIQVVRSSDKVKSGTCRVGDIKINKDKTRITHVTTSQKYFSFGCKENDKNGGDCTINAQLHCQRVDVNTIKTIPFDCTVSGNNAGCSKSVRCPVGYIAYDARASCNLETPERKPLPEWGWLEVKRPSDKKSRHKSQCSVNETSRQILKRHMNIANAKKLIISCKEHDKNGGDCNINGELQCAKLVLDNPINQMKKQFVEPAPKVNTSKK